MSEQIKSLEDKLENTLHVKVDNSTDETQASSNDKLQWYVNRIENLEEQKKDISDDIKSVYAEADVHGFDKKVLKEVIRWRKKEASEAKYQLDLFDVYWNEL